MPGSANEKVLKLDTAGTVWSNNVTGAYFAEAPIWVDMLVKFVESDTLPELTDPNVKLAIAATNGWLMVTRSTGTENVWTNTAAAINTSLWYRVTVMLETDTTANKFFATVTLNGSAQPVTGDKFEIYHTDENVALNSIGFQGTGYIDEVVVRDDAPFGDAGVEITLSFAAGVQSVYIVGGAQKLDTEKVPDGTDLEITAAQWKEISGVSGDGVDVTWLSGSQVGDSIVTVKVEAASSATVTISAQTETSPTPYPGTTSFTNAPADKVAEWALTNLISNLAGLTEDIYDDYLFNVATNSNPTLMINSISVSGTTATVTVGAGTVDFSKINGKLKITAYPTLGGTPTNYPSVTVPVSTNNVTITQDIGENKFIKARIDPVD
jgi:hypothetical protein